MIHDVIARWHQHMHGEPGVLDELLDVLESSMDDKYVNGVDIIRIKDAGSH